VSCKQSGNHTNLINIHNVDIILKNTRTHIFLSLSPLSLSFFQPFQTIWISRADFNCRIIVAIASNAISAQIVRIVEKKMNQQRERRDKNQRCKLFATCCGKRGRVESRGLMMRDKIRARRIDVAAVRDIIGKVIDLQLLTQ